MTRTDKAGSQQGTAASPFLGLVSTDYIDSSPWSSAITSRSALHNLLDFPIYIWLPIYYDQIDGVAMGSPLDPVLGNIFMCHLKTDGWWTSDSVLHFGSDM